MTTQKQYEKIRNIATTSNGGRFAVAENYANVQVWDLSEGLVNKFSTDFDFGNYRLSISEDGTYLVVGGYSANTVTAYNIDTKQQIWQRKDLKKCGSVIILNKSDNQVFVHLEKQGTHILDIKTGNTLKKLRGVEFYYENPFADIDLLEKCSSFSITDRTTKKAIKSLPKTTFAILDVAFSEDKIICTYSGGPLEAMSTNSFEKIRGTREVGRFLDEALSLGKAMSRNNFEKIWETRVVGHFLEIEYSSEIDKILGIRWEYEKGSPKYLCYINIDTGKVEKEIDLGDIVETGFLKQGTLLLTSEGRLYSTLTGQQIEQFDFESQYSQ